MSFNLRNEPFESHVTVPRAFAPHECEAIRQLFVGGSDGVIGAGEVNKSIRDSRIHWLLYTPEHHWIFEKIASIVNDVNERFFGLDLKQTEGIQLTEYDALYKGFYGQHIDAAYDARSSARHRKLSVTIQLTSGDAYEGGDLQLYPLNFNSPFTASRGIGDMTLFRSNVIHEVLPVTKGKRMSLVTWVVGPLLR